jgi:hypothetical protein
VSAIEKKRGHYLGTEIDETWWRRYTRDGFLARGLGEYWIDASALLFQRYLTGTPLVIPFAEMVDVAVGKWHSGRWAGGTPVVKIAWERSGSRLSSGFVLSRDARETDEMVRKIRSLAGRAGPLVYPVLCLSRELGPFVARDPARLRSCRAGLFWGTRFYDGLRLVGADGESHEVVGVRLRRPASPIGQRLARFLDLCVVVDFDTRRVGSASLSDVAGAVNAAIDEDPEAFEEVSGRDAAWWKREIGRCTTVVELIQKLDAHDERARHG